MLKKYRRIATIAILTFLLVGLSGVMASAQSTSPEKEEQYRELLSSVDGVIRTIRLNNEVTENRMDRLEDQYENVFGEVLETPSLSVLNGDKEGAIETMKNIRMDIEEKGETEGLEVSFIYNYSILIILGVSFGLAITVNMISRKFVNWEEVNRVRNKQSELQDKLKKAKKENESKKARKLEKEQQEFMQQHMGTMFSPMKTMLIIIVPFIIVFQLLSSTYGGWVVAWLPFRLPWPDIGFLMFDRFFKGPVASLGFFGWYLMAYFGFSQIWRKILVPSQ